MSKKRLIAHKTQALPPPVTPVYKNQALPPSARHQKWQTPAGYTFPEVDLVAGRQGEQDKLQRAPAERAQAVDHGDRTRIIVVPTKVSENGSDGDARLRHVLGRVSATYDPAFLFFCNEHTFVIAENLRGFVRDLDPSEPVYLGNRFRKEASHVGDGRDQGWGEGGSLRLCFRAARQLHGACFRKTKW